MRSSVVSASTLATSWRVTLSTAGISGTVTVTITNPAAGGTVAMDIKGLPGRSLSVLWLRGGACSVTGPGVARVRWWVPGTGHLVLRVNLSPAMAGRFMFDLQHRGGVNATITDGSADACAVLRAA